MSEPAVAPEPAPSPAPALTFEWLGDGKCRLTVVGPETVLDRAGVLALRLFLDAQVGSAFHRTRRPT